MSPRSTSFTELSGPTGAAGNWARAATVIPSHIAGATAGRTSRFAGSAANENTSKWCAAIGAVIAVAFGILWARDVTREVRPEVPEIELLTYPGVLRSVTHGTGSFTRRPLGYEPAPANLAVPV